MKILSLGDSVHIADLKLIADKNSKGYFLDYYGGGNEEIFKKLKVEKLDIQSAVLGYTETGHFPYCRSIEDLSKFSQALEVISKGGSISKSASILRVDYTVDLSSEKIKKDSKINNFLLLGL